MIYTTLHHTVTDQFKTNPKVFKFYNIVITPTKVYRRSYIPHERGNGIQSVDVALTGDFRYDTPTDYQLSSLKKVINELGHPVIGHNQLKEKGATVGKLNTLCPAKLMTFLKESMELTKEQVEKMYASWDLVDLDGVKYWTGKALDALLDARIQDKIKQLDKYKI